MLKRIIEISSGPARLSVNRRQLIIDREGKPKGTVPCEDVGILIVDNPAVSYTQTVFTELLSHGSAIVVCGSGHLPTGMLLPIESNIVQTERFSDQISATLPLKKRIWQSIIQCKLRMQGAVLKKLFGSDSGLIQLSKLVASGDPKNIEGQGSLRYWRALLGSQFRRDRYGPPPNHLLNYGYTILRSAVARALCIAGLLPTLGVHHHNRYNAYCLADDVMEPYRPLIDQRVMELVTAGRGDAELTQDVKQVLISTLHEIIPIGRNHTPALLAIQRTAFSLQKSFEFKKVILELPNGLPIPDEMVDEGGYEE